MKTLVVVSLGLLLALAPARASDALPDAEFTFAPVTRAPDAVASFGATVLGGRFYMLGGHCGAPHSHSRQTQTAAFRSFTEAGDWREHTNAVALQGLALVSDGKHLVRVGGMMARNAAGEEEDLWSSADCARFDPQSGAWSKLPNLPQARSSHDAWVLDGKLYVFGGWKLAGRSSEGQWLDSGLVLDLARPEPVWKEIAQPFRRRALAVTAARGKVYVMGGITEDRRMSRRVDVYDVAGDRWSEGPALPGMGFGSSACELDGRVYVSDWAGRISRLSEDGSRWEEVFRLGIPRFFHRLLPAGRDRLVALCGTGAQGHTNTIEWLDLKARGPLVSTLRLEFKGNARQRQGVFVHGTQLTVFGGNTETEQHLFEKENFSRQSWRLDYGIGRAEALNDLPAQRQSVVPLLVPCPNEPQTYWLAFGGFGFDEEHLRCHDQAFIYDLAKDAWRDLGVKLPRRLTQFGLASVEGNVWLFGGMDYDSRLEGEKQFAFNDSVYFWDPHSKEGFVEKARLPRSRRAFAGAALDGKYFMVGGLKQGFGSVLDCDVYDFAQGTWSTMTAPSRPRVSASLVPLNGKLYLIGGSSPKASGRGIEPNDSIEVYDPATNTWKMLIQKLPVSTKEAQAFATDTRLLIYSAAQEGHFVDITLIDPGR